MGRATFTARVGQASLSRYLARAKPLLPGLSVTLRPSDVEARVPVTFLRLQTVAALRGTFAPDAADPQTLDFVASGAQVGVVPLPAGLANLAVARLNPVVSLTGLKAPLAISHADVQDGRLVLQGSADLNGLVGR